MLFAPHHLAVRLPPTPPWHFVFYKSDLDLDFVSGSLKGNHLSYLSTNLHTLSNDILLIVSKHRLKTMYSAIQVSFEGIKRISYPLHSAAFNPGVLRCGWSDSIVQDAASSYSCL